MMRNPFITESCLIAVFGHCQICFKIRYYIYLISFFILYIPFIFGLIRILKQTCRLWIILKQRLFFIMFNRDNVYTNNIIYNMCEVNNWKSI